MDWDAIAPALGAELRHLPAVVLASALGDWDATAPHLLRLLEAFGTGEDRSPEVANQLCYLLHLAAEREERRAFAPLCALLRDGSAAEAVFGDAIDETLACILIRTYDDDPAPLHALIEDATAGETTRMTALHALAWLTATGRIPREDAAAYLAAVFGRMEPRGESLAWLGWQDAVAWLGLVDLREAAAELFRRGWVGPEWLEFEDFDSVLREAVAATDPLALLRREGPPMFDSAIAELAEWSAFRGDAAAEDDDVVLNQPYVNPYRNVGRNDPCPCGSGRKFKKCCLGKV